MTNPLPEPDLNSRPCGKAQLLRIRFFAAGNLKRIDIAGGLPTVLADASDLFGGMWNRDGVSVFAP
jgi:hypothetical protein